MKKLKMIVTSVIVLAIVGSAYAFNAKKIGKFCVSEDGDNICDGVLNNSKRSTSGFLYKYIEDWDGVSCAGRTICSTNALFKQD